MEFRGTGAGGSLLYGPLPGLVLPVSIDCGMYHPCLVPQVRIGEKEGNDLFSIQQDFSKPLGKKREKGKKEKERQVEKEDEGLRVTKVSNDLPLTSTQLPIK